MRNSASALPLALLALSAISLGGCPESKEKPTERTIKEYKTASEGFKAAIPNTDNLPNKKALDNMQRTLEENDKTQERYERKIETAPEKE